MALPIVKTWRSYFENDPHEGLGSSYERVVLNFKLEQLRTRYGISSCLEAPVFGFTGLTGINSMGLAKSGVRVTLVDDHRERLGLIKSAWRQAGETFAGVVQDFTALPFADKSFDLGWNFSALWFVPDIRRLLEELTRVTRKAIFLCVPNPWGIGVFLDKYISVPELRRELKDENVSPGKLIRCMRLLGWNLAESGYIDVPPWPDIGMKKEEFLKRLGLGFLATNRKSKTDRPLTIMKYYTGTDPDFLARMARYHWFEKQAPRLVKAVWAHHRYLLFDRDGMSEQKDVCQTKTHCVANERAH
jgi:SAM-dependent methyltransferase